MNPFNAGQGAAEETLADLLKAEGDIRHIEAVFGWDPFGIDEMPVLEQISGGIGHGLGGSA